jgi:hypothetical protein
MQAEVRIGYMMILVDVIHPIGVEERGAAFDSVDFVAFLEE